MGTGSWVLGSGYWVSLMYQSSSVLLDNSAGPARGEVAFPRSEHGESGFESARDGRDAQLGELPVSLCELLHDDDVLSHRVLHFLQPPLHNESRGKIPLSI